MKGVTAGGRRSAHDSSRQLAVVGVVVGRSAKGKTWSGRRRLGRPSDAVGAPCDCRCAHAPMLHRYPHAAHFRAHVLANGDEKLRNSTYVIDPADNNIAE